MSKISVSEYRKELDNTLLEYKNMISHLRLRLELMDEFFSDKSDYEKNEAEITKIKTQTEIKTLERIVIDKERYFVEFMKQFEVDAKDCNDNWDMVYNQAKLMQNRNPMVKKLLENINWDVMEKEPEVKIAIFKTLKKQLK